MSYLSHKWNLWRLNLERRKIRKRYAKKLADLRNSKTTTTEDYRDLEADDYYAEKDLQEATSAFYSNTLIRQAAECDVEIPAITEEFWDHTDGGEQYYLNLKGRDLVRERIVKAKDLQSADWARWAKIAAPIIGALTGLIGVIIGLIAVLQHKK